MPTTHLQGARLNIHGGTFPSVLFYFVDIVRVHVSGKASARLCMSCVSKLVGKLRIFLFFDIVHVHVRGKASACLSLGCVSKLVAKLRTVFFCLI